MKGRPYEGPYERAAYEGAAYEGAAYEGADGMRGWRSELIGPGPSAIDIRASG